MLDEDGFEVPTLIKECVVIETDDYNIAKVHTSTPGKKKEEKKKELPSVNENGEEEEQPDLADLPMSYKPMAQERRGADLLNLYLSFVKADPKDTTPDAAFEAHLVNDCNFYLRYVILAHEGNACNVRFEGEIEPNTKVYLEDIRRSGLEQWENLTVQALAYKRTKTFLAKQPMHIQLRIDGSKFYKPGTFRSTPFFTVPALTFDLIRDDRPVRTVNVETNEIKQAWYGERETAQPARISGAEARAQRREQQTDPDAPKVVDLHADQLLDNMVGLTNADILEYQLKVFRDVLNDNLRHIGRRIVFIHGKGEGVLRRSLLHELSTRYKQCIVQDASFREYGYGATMVIIGNK